MLRFDGKVVIVTGAAGAMGTAYCHLFAERGALIVVNDICCDVSGNLATAASQNGSKNGSAAAAVPMTTVQRLVDELNAVGARTGARAVASYDDVLQGGKIVQCALDNFGRVDVVVNNAGVLRDRSFASMSDADWDAVVAVHLRGAYAVTRAAWPHMLRQSYGRVVMVTSTSGLYGNFGQANYAAAKLALVGLAQTLALEGEGRGIKVNSVAPVGVSRMTEQLLPRDLHGAFPPAAVAPLVLCLAHESCPDSGALFEAGGGWHARLRWQRSAGVKLAPPTDAAAGARTATGASAVTSGAADVSGGTPVTPEALQSLWGELSSFFGPGEPDYPVDGRSGIAQAVTRPPTQLRTLLESPAARAYAASTQHQQQQQQQQQQLQQQHQHQVQAHLARSQQQQHAPAPLFSVDQQQQQAAAATGATAPVHTHELPRPAQQPTQQQQQQQQPVFEFEAERIMTLLREFLDRSVVQKTKGVFVFEVTNAAKKKKTWTLDLKNNDGALYEGLPTAPAKADATLALSDEDFKRLVYNETQPQKLFLTGRLKVKGNLALALKFEGVLRSLEDKARAKL